VQNTNHIQGERNGFEFPVRFVELKSVAEIIPQHQAQLLTYMKLLKVPKGILLNFNSDNIFKNGQETFVNEFFRSLADS
jgi:hypothetical protein